MYNEETVFSCRENTILRSYLFIPVFSQPVHWISRITYKFALEEGDVETRGVVVDKLE